MAHTLISFLGRVPKGGQLARAAYYERTSNPVKAREALTTWFNRADRHPDHDSAAHLFRNQLEARVRWFRLPDRPAWEKHLAREYSNPKSVVDVVDVGWVSAQRVTQHNQDVGLRPTA